MHSTRIIMILKFTPFGNVFSSLWVLGVGGIIIIMQSTTSKIVALGPEIQYSDSDRMHPQNLNMVVATVTD